jgi:hypothetical protein
MLALQTIALDEAHSLFTGALPTPLVPDATAFDELWALHPDTFHEIVMHGRKVRAQPESAPAAGGLGGLPPS